MIKLDQVCFGYQANNLLFDTLSLELSPGHIYGLLGKNGEGKSTLLRNIAGLLFPFSGQIRVDVHEPRFRDAGFLQDLFFVPEEIYLPSLSVKAFVNYYGPLYPKFDASDFFEIISEFQIPQGCKLDEISYGQKKKVLIAFALAAHTKTVLMDEPTNGLDIPSKSSFRKLILSHFDEDRVFVISTHQVRDLEQLIDAVIILNDGKIAIQESVSKICDRVEFNTLAHIHGGDRILYQQSSIGGFKVIRENVFGVESKFELEPFFNAVISDPSRIQEVIQGSSYKSNS